MYKRERLYLGLFALIVVLAAAGFVYSQAGGSFATTVQNPGHTANQILCNGCIYNSNVNTFASIDQTKIVGVNGHAVTISITPITTPLPSGITSAGTGIVNGSHNWVLYPPPLIFGNNIWVSKKVETLCEWGNAFNAGFPAYGGLNFFQIVSGNSYWRETYNHYTVTLEDSNSGTNNVYGLPGYGWKHIYLDNQQGNYPSTPTASMRNELYIRAVNGGSNQLEIGQVISISGTGFTPLSLSNWDCIIKYVGA